MNAFSSAVIIGISLSLSPTYLNFSRATFSLPQYIIVFTFSTPTKFLVS